MSGKLEFCQTKIIMKKEHIFITGATGFIGSHVTEHFISNNSYQIVTVVRKTADYKKVASFRKKGAIVLEGDFFDTRIIDRIFHEFPIHHVIHLASLRGAGFAAKQVYYKVNVAGTEILLEHSLRNNIKKFIFCSSVGVLGTIPTDLPATMNTQLNADNTYHKSKLLAEDKVREFMELGLDAYIVRPTISYGHGDRGFPKTLVDLVRRRLLFLPNEDIHIHLLNVRKFAELLNQMIGFRSPQKRAFFAADANPISLEKLVNLIHFHYHGSQYPSYLRLPNQIFDLLSIFFRLLSYEKWLTRTLLISKSWYYDITDIVNTFEYTPARTEDSFIKVMCS